MTEHHDLQGDLKTLYPHKFKSPKIHSSVYQAPGSLISGDVEIGENSSIWCNTVLRGDVNYIRVGQRTNIQDLTMVHVSFRENPTIIGNDVTIGHHCILHAC